MPPPQQEEFPQVGEQMSSRLSFTPKMEQVAHHQALTEVAQARKNLYELAMKGQPVKTSILRRNKLIAAYRELDAMMLAEKPEYIKARTQQLKGWVESLPADPPEELFA